MNQYILFEKATGAIMAISNQPLLANDSQEVMMGENATILCYVDLATKTIIPWTSDCTNETINEIYKHRVPPTSKL